MKKFSERARLGDQSDKIAPIDYVNAEHAAQSISSDRARQIRMILKDSSPKCIVSMNQAIMKRLF